MVTSNERNDLVWLLAMKEIIWFGLLAMKEIIWFGLLAMKDIIWFGFQKAGAFIPLMFKTLTNLNTKESTNMKMELEQLINKTEVLRTINEKDIMGATKGKKVQNETCQTNPFYLSYIYQFRRIFFIPL